MAIRSLLLSLAVTCLLGYSLTFGLTDPHSFLKRLPDWTAIPILSAGAGADLLAVWWACREFREQKRD
jgi:membrane protein DedA with SNARE-associated domain